jgi:hypothetical protein
MLHFIIDTPDIRINSQCENIYYHKGNNSFGIEGLIKHIS